MRRKQEGPSTSQENHRHLHKGQLTPLRQNLCQLSLTPEGATKQNSQTATISSFHSPVSTVSPTLTTWSYSPHFNRHYSHFSPLWADNLLSYRTSKFISSCPHLIFSPDVTTTYKREDATSPLLTATPPAAKPFVRPWES